MKNKEYSNFSPKVKLCCFLKSISLNFLFQVFVIGIQPEQGEIDLEQMTAIAGSSQNFFFAEPGIEVDDIDLAISRRIRNRVCRVRC